MRLQDVAQLAGLNLSEFEQVQAMSQVESNQIVLALALRLGNLKKEIESLVRKNNFSVSEIRDPMLEARQQTFKEEIDDLKNELSKSSNQGVQLAKIVSDKEAELRRADERFTDMSIKLSAIEKELFKTKENAMSRMEIIEDQKIEIERLKKEVSRSKTIEGAIEDLAVTCILLGVDGPNKIVFNKKTMDYIENRIQSRGWEFSVKIPENSTIINTSAGRIDLVEEKS